LALSDLYQESELFMKPGDAVVLDGPLDFVIGIIESVDGAFVRMAPGCVTSRNIDDQTKLVATGRPTNRDYCVKPRGRLVPMLAITGIDYLPGFDPKDWPALGGE
jgi:hypothetical protein